MGKVKQIACIGGKVIGSSWAVNFSMKGYPVTLTTTRQTTLEDAKAKVEAFLDALAEQAVLTRRRSTAGQRTCVLHHQHPRRSAQRRFYPGEYAGQSGAEAAGAGAN